MLDTFSVTSVEGGANFKHFLLCHLARAHMSESDLYLEVVDNKRIVLSHLNPSLNVWVSFS